MKRISKLVYAGLAMMLCAFFLLPVQASEPEAEQLVELPDPAKSVEFKIDCELDGVELKGVQVDLYHVANLVGTLPMDFEFTPDFLSYPVLLKGLNQKQWGMVCTTLNSYVVADELPPLYTGETNDSGMVVFPELSCGLYLVRFQDHEQGDYIYHGSPMLVYLPDYDYDVTHDWNYNVLSYGKFTREKEEIPTEEEFVSRKVIKVWNDKGNESKRPHEIVVNLYRDGALYDTVTLNEENSWCHEWDKLPASSTYEMTEKKVSGYTVIITKDGTAYTVQNTYHDPDVPTEDPTEPPTTPPTEPPTTPPTQPPTTPPTTPPTYQPKPPKPKPLPQTGQMWWPVAALGGGGLLMTLLGVRLRKVKKHE